MRTGDARELLSRRSASSVPSAPDYPAAVIGTCDSPRSTCVGGTPPFRRAPGRDVLAGLGVLAAQAATFAGRTLKSRPATSSPSEARFATVRV
jgi:hypothetical protein